MAFYKMTSFVGPNEEKLSAWLVERHALPGKIVRLKEDEHDREWTVAEVGNQVVMDSQLDLKHAVTPIEDAPLPKAVRSRKPKLEAAPDVN
jgi:pantothenate kinase